MQSMRMLIVITVLIFVAEGPARGSTAPATPPSDGVAVTASAHASLTMMNGGTSLSPIIPLAALHSTFSRFLDATNAEDGNGNGGNPPPRSVHCPPDKDDHHDHFQNNGTNQDKGQNQDKDNKDNDHHDDCGKGDDGRNP